VEVPAVVVDVDGTLVDVSGVRHYVVDDPNRRDFHHFHTAAAFAPPVASTVDRVRALAGSGVAVFVVTARRSRWERQTRDWLTKHDVPYDALCMRGDADGRPDVDVKRDLLVGIRRTHHVVLAIDDNPSVIALWQEEGIPVEVVPGWIVEE
jgi:phosphoglycolate phosphatase-like HAD superfamily hydrolase